MSEPQTPSSSPTPAPKKPRGFRIPAPVAAILVVIALLAGAWLVYTQLFVKKEINLADFESPDSPAARMRARFFDDSAVVGVSLRDNRVSYTIIGAQGGCTFPESKPPTLTLQYTGGPEWDGYRVRAAAMLDKDEQASAKVTPEQIEKLRATPFPRDVPLTDADRGKLIELCDKFRKAPEDQRKPIEAEIIAFLRTHAAAGLTATLEAQAAAHKQVRAILTPQQYNQLRPRPRRPRI